MENDIKNILAGVVHYYNTTRRVGHTTVMLAGVIGSPPSAIVIQNLSQKTFISNSPQLNKSQKFIVLDQLVSSFPPSLNLPLAWDNLAIQTLCSNSLRKILELEDEIARLKSEKSI